LDECSARGGVNYGCHSGKKDGQGWTVGDQNMDEKCDLIHPSSDKTNRMPV
jgi:hypothetical protein